MNFENKNLEEQNFQNLNLYPTIEQQANATNQNNGNLFNKSNILEFVKLFALLKSKKLDFNSILASNLGKNFANKEELSTILNLFGSKTQTLGKENLPKIDSLKKIN